MPSSSIRAQGLLASLLVLGWSQAAGAQVDFDASIEACGPVGLECPGDKLVIEIVVAHDVASSQQVVLVETAQRRGVPERLPQAVAVSLGQTAPKLVYPLAYLHDVAYFPYEEVIRVQNAFVGIQACVDDPASPELPHCWRPGGDPGIPYSEGFCCNKSEELLIGGADNEWWRGEEVLGERSMLMPPANWFSTAHCLRPGNAVWSGFDLDPGLGVVEADVAVLAGPRSQSFGLDLAGLTFRSRDEPTPPELNLQAELVGDYTALQNPVDLTPFGLYRASEPPSDPYVQAWHDHLMLIPDDQVTLDGSECDKIGVGYQVFQQERNVCPTSQAGDCLQNQLFHLHVQDLELLAQDPNADTSWLVRGLKDYRDVASLTPGPPARFERRLPAIERSDLRIEIDMDDLAPSAIPTLRALLRWLLPGVLVVAWLVWRRR